jgi:hypothetical protein
MAEFSIDRFKYNWKGDWTAGADYIRDDIVRIGGKSYVCVVGHTASTEFRTDQAATVAGSNPPIPQPRWVVMTSSRSFIGQWTSAVEYNIGDIVQYQGSLYVCKTAHLSDTWHDDSVGVDESYSNPTNNWLLFALGQGYQNEWTAFTSYGLGATVRYGGYIYKCVKTHQSSNFENETGNWIVHYNGYEYKGAWNTNTTYKLNDLVKYGGGIFVCTETHTSGTELIDDTKFAIEIPGSEYDGQWSSTVFYNEGDIVRYGGHSYYAINSNIDSQPGLSQVNDTDDSTINWRILQKNYNFRGQWDKLYQTPFRTGDIVQRGGYLYRAIKDISIADGDGSTLDYLDPEIWEQVSSGKVFLNTWNLDQIYSIGEVVTYRGTAWVCNQEHESAVNNFPGDNGSGYVFWDTLIQAGQDSGMLYAGDMLTYGLSRELGEGQGGDGSSVGSARIPGGTVGQLLSVQKSTDQVGELEAYWRTYTADADKVYVGAHGKDDAENGYGFAVHKPFKTVRYACDWVHDNIGPLVPAKVEVLTGRYEEVGPITIPAGCVVMGDELRATTIVATGPKAEYATTWTQHSAAISHIESIISDVSNNNAIVKQVGNNLTQILDFPATSDNAVNSLAQLFADYKNYTEFRIQSGDTDPTVTGTNTENSDNARINLSTILTRAKNFLAEEGYYYMVNTYPEITFDKNKECSDLKYLIRGLIRDVKFDGNYATLLAGRYYANSVNGSKTDDLFWVRDTTGLRNCTTDGLTGTLNPPGVFAQYQRPTGGACVALDPGWGPADNRTWIINRSPYLQGVTNLGTACVGKRIDGTLHNGGNRSMVSNDFTQVLSDGIGAWVSDNARAELVSVFTYYCQVGYLAENGGVIRATNGNNSYGTYGSIAEGNDPNEVAQAITVDNTQNEAIVSAAFAGGSSDQIFAFEYNHCGEQYTSATADIVGAGADALVDYDEFRNGALNHARLINTQGSGSEGGSGYVIRQNSAQVTSGATSRLILNTNEETQFDTEILGARILITQGTGVGQYGYVAAYDTNTKELIVRKESTSELGWDHVLPGYAIEANLDSTTTYRIEPRIACNHPGFTKTHTNLSAARNFIDGQFGGLTAFYFNVELPEGSEGVQEAAAITAEISVQRSGQTYIVNLTNPGAGYGVGQVMTVLGTALGGTTPKNDLTVTVVSTTEDSTNAITDISTTGLARDGRYVALAEPNFVVYSDDGTSWSESNLSAVLDYQKLLIGRNRFIALAKDTNQYSFSYDAVNWTTRTLPSSQAWSDGAHGFLPSQTHRFVAIAENSNTAAYSSDGLNWATSTLPTGDDSAGDQWLKIAYGQRRFVVISGSQTKDVAYSADGVTWNMYSNVLPADYDWINLEYGNNRFLAFSATGDTAYSLDRGATWQLGTVAPSPDGSTPMVWTDIKYGQGVFIAVCQTQVAKDYGEPLGFESGPTRWVVTTEDGVLWREYNLDSPHEWQTIMFNTTEKTPTWIALGKNQLLNAVVKINTGALAKVRSNITAKSFTEIKIWDPGSGYDQNTNPVTFTITDSGYTTEVETDRFIRDNVLPQPQFVDRGAGYKTSTSTITISGNGFADIIPEGQFVTVSGVSASIPGPGVQIRFTTIDDEVSDDPDVYKLFTGVGSTDLGDDGTGNGTRVVRFQISPTMKNEYNLATGTIGTLNTGYSQCRISGHDFLDIGTGNFVQTNYPALYASGAYFTALPENEVLEVDGGRVFYVSTDQDGNFRAGELFGVNQATGVVTISAEFFDLDGLSELALGGVRLGGTGTVVNEFSTDATFSADSNAIIPTQKAIATFLADRLSVGGSDLETNAITAGQVSIGTSDNRILMTGDSYLNIPREVHFDGVDDLGNPTAIQGTIVSQMLYARTFNENMQ